MRSLGCCQLLLHLRPSRVVLDEHLDATLQPLDRLLLLAYLLNSGGVASPRSFDLLRDRLHLLAQLDDVGRLGDPLLPLLLGDSRSCSSLLTLDEFPDAPDLSGQVGQRVGLLQERTSHGLLVTAPLLLQQPVELGRRAGSFTSVVTLSFGREVFPLALSVTFAALGSFVALEVSLGIGLVSLGGHTLAVRRGVRRQIGVLGKPLSYERISTHLLPPAGVVPSVIASPAGR